VGAPPPARHAGVVRCRREVVVERTLAHLSDLHVGRDPGTDARVARIPEALARAGVDAILVSGDVTHRGRRSEVEAFERMFAPVRDRTVVVPGNHDRLGDDAGRLLMSGARVAVETRPGLHVVRLDSTAPHNRALLAAHGALSDRDLEEVGEAVRAAPPAALVVVMLHHHLHPLPADHVSERLATWLGWPNAAELARAQELLAVLRGRCDLVVHAHRHAASARVVADARRPLRVLNAGSTPELGWARLLVHAGGRVVAERRLAVEAPAERRLALDAPEARRGAGRAARLRTAA
jgi:3',5'-cyclic AMP phosphodiesterase CpdA